MQQEAFSLKKIESAKNKFDNERRQDLIDLNCERVISQDRNQQKIKALKEEWTLMNAKALRQQIKERKVCQQA